MIANELPLFGGQETPLSSLRSVTGDRATVERFLDFRRRWIAQHSEVVVGENMAEVDGHAPLWYGWIASRPT